MNMTPELLEKYYKGLCTPEEVTAIEQWMDAADPQELNLPPGESKEEQKEIIWAPLQSMMAESHSTPVKQITKRNKTIWWAAAASLIIISGAALYVSKFKASPQQTIAATPVYKTIRTEKGQRLQHRLPDGSIVHLNSETEIRYAENFSDSSRDIQLTGEAYFNVAKDSKRSFSIYTSTTLTRVLGTVFNLKAYPDEKVSVVVAEGKVQFGALDNSQYRQTYTINQSGIYEDGKNPTLQNVVAANYSGWINNRINLNGQTFHEIIPVLERWFNVRIIASNKQLLQQTFTGSFDNPDLKFILGRLGFVMNFDYSISKDTVRVTNYKAIN